VRAADARPRDALVRRALHLEYLTIGWNSVEAVVGIAAGVAAGSAALVAFALDSVVEMSSGGVLVWRLRGERKGQEVERIERRAIKGVAVAFFALALYVGVQGGMDLMTRDRPAPSRAGIVLACVSIVAMPLLAWRKRIAARSLDSRSLLGDSTQTVLCALLSVVLLAGLLANELLGWWWADPVAAIAIAALAAREGYELWTTEDICC
jgi:divalent metal cation (Fe/Co/Zn/Cd) transporter